MSQPSHALAAVDVARVLIVANDEPSLQRTAHALREAGFAVASVGDEQLALRSLGPEIDLIVVTDGLQLDARGLCAAIRARSRLPIVMLGTRSAEDDVVRAFDAGVDDYLASPWSDRTLVARIGAVLRRSDAPTLAVVAYGDTVLDVAARRLLHGDSALPLTLLETGVLRALLARPGRVVTNGALATEAWGRSGPRERRSLKQTIYRLRQKLESESAFDGRLQSLRGSGYRWRTDDLPAR
jgi:DNA-binding response OmpR family regulator